MNFEYNILNLLHNVREGSIIMAGYEYSYGGVKLKVWDSDGNGYAYVGTWFTGLRVVLLFLKAVFLVRGW
ncbi:hypothetical protein DXA95_17070 [Odoribacter sp. OF09-27XD]|nr:hypothetical protein DXA95_17070 [Odoribacter sp. OF09-27XD]